MSLTIAMMDLTPLMEQRARELEAAFPNLIHWTSGKRTVYAQARAMAVNHLHDPLRYLVSQYTNGKRFVEALEMGPITNSVEGVTNVFYELMIRNPDLVHSTHYEGRAVDIQPIEDANNKPTDDGYRVIAWINGCEDTEDFRTREGTLPRWHWSCKERIEV